MCISRPNVPPPAPAPPPPPPAPVLATGPNNEGEGTNQRKRTARDALKIDLPSGGTASASGLQVQ